MTTSGTLSNPVSFYLTDKDLDRLATNEEASFKLVGANPTDLFQMMVTLDKQFMAGLAYYLSLKYAPDRTQNLKLLYEDELLRAEAADGSETSTYITPKTYYPSV